MTSSIPMPGSHAVGILVSYCSDLCMKSSSGAVPSASAS